MKPPTPWWIVGQKVRGTVWDLQPSLGTSSLSRVAPTETSQTLTHHSLFICFWSVTPVNPLNDPELFSRFVKILLNSSGVFRRPPTPNLTWFKTAATANRPKHQKCPQVFQFDRIWPEVWGSSSWGGPHGRKSLWSMPGSCKANRFYKKWPRSGAPMCQHHSGASCGIDRLKPPKPNHNRVSYFLYVICFFNLFLRKFSSNKNPK